MRVMVIVKASRQSEAGEMPTKELLAAMGKFNEELIKAGVMLDGAGLRPTSHAARVRFAGAQRTATRGPFPLSSDLIAGYWVWNVKSVDEAIEWLNRCPNPHPDQAECEVEIRPLYEESDFA